MLWACWVEDHVEVRGGAVPTQPIADDVGQLFVAALRKHFGPAASAVAEREWQLGEHAHPVLPARTVRRAVACADSALSFLQGQAQLMQIEFSAVMGGWRFYQVVGSLGLDRANLSLERRQALDQLMAPHFVSALPASPESLAERLRALLTAGWH